jgi:hypothetical protein
MSRRDVTWFLSGMLCAAVVLLGLWALRGRSSPVTAAVDPHGVLSAGDASSAGESGLPGMQGGAASQGGSAGSLNEVTRSLVQRLASKGGTDEDWLLLAQSYEFMGRSAAAAAARRHELPAPDTLEAGPDSAAAAVADAGAGSTTDLAGVAAALDGTRAHRSAQAARITGTVEVASALAARVPKDATLFIYVKAPEGGAPLAVLRTQAGNWPVPFTLDDSNAMVPGHNLSGAAQVKIEARISVRGDALPRPGDLVGTVTDINPHTGHPVRIAIDREIG